MVDFINKTDGRVVNKSKLEALAKAGCFDTFDVPRKFIHDGGKNLRDKFNSFMRKKEKDGYDVNSAAEEFPFNFDDGEWHTPQKLKYEQEVLGELVSGNIYDLYPGFFQQHGITPISHIRRMPDGAEIMTEGIITLSREIKIKKEGRLKGKVMAKYQVEDVFGSQTEMTVWPDSMLTLERELRKWSFYRQM